MINVNSKNLGYRECALLGAWLCRCAHDSRIYRQINEWTNEDYDVIIGYDVHYDAPYISIGFSILYEDDFY